MTDMPAKIARTPWRVAVWVRLRQVEDAVDQAIRARGWSLGGNRRISGYPAGQAREAAAAQDVVTTTDQFIKAADESLDRPDGMFRRVLELLTGQLLMAAYANLHAAEKQRVLLTNPMQLAALLPSIRARAIAYLDVSDPRRVALDGIPDLTAPSHQALATRLQRQIAGTGGGQPPARRGRPARRSPGRGIPSRLRHVLHAQGPAPVSPADPAASGAQLTPMLGEDQWTAFEALGAAFTAEDQQQGQVRRFRGVLLGTFGSLLVLAVILGVVGYLHPELIPLCLHSQGATGATRTKMICPSGHSAPGKADLALVLCIGGVGATLAVARSLAGLSSAGVRYSLSVAQGLLKVSLGAITAVLGLLLLQTQTGLPGILGSQGGLLTSAVVFGYAQQLFTGIIDHRAASLMSAASPATPG
jgi:hypothetical protein